MSDDCQGFFSPESISILKAVLAPYEAGDGIQTHEFSLEASTFSAEESE